MNNRKTKMERMTLTFDQESLLLDFCYLYECFDRHISYMETNEAWLTAETLARVGAFVDTMGQKFPIIVASVSEDMANCALEGMREWSDTTMPADGWPDELLERLYSNRQ